MIIHSGRICGKKSTSCMLGALVISMQRRSIPIPFPPPRRRAPRTWMPLENTMANEPENTAGRAEDAATVALIDKARNEGVIQ